VIILSIRSDNVSSVWVLDLILSQMELISLLVLDSIEHIDLFNTLENMFSIPGSALLAAQLK
jgi:hypothetical protein